MLLTQKQKFKRENLSILVTFQDTWTGAATGMNPAQLKRSRTVDGPPECMASNVALRVTCSAYVSHTTSPLVTHRLSMGQRGPMRNISVHYSLTL